METQYTVTVQVNQKLLKKINRWLKSKKSADRLGENDAASVTAVFPDGRKADIKCCGCQDGRAYAEGVLFDADGCQLCWTEPSDSFDGEWWFEYDGVTYTVIVETNTAKNN